MKVLLLLLIGSLGLLGCNNKPTASLNKTVTTTDNTIKLRPLEKLSLDGDFDGDGKKDTLFEHIYSNKTMNAIDSAADPFQNDWATVTKWFYDKETDVYLTINKKNSDTLHLGTAQGLYCLINIGDNNKDGKDEIAFVVDRLDDSRTNTCAIYTLCNNKWTLLKELSVNEAAFNFSTEQAPVFTEIKNYLEKRNGKWVYKADTQDDYDLKQDAGKMKILQLDQCK
jgi:hypothetical protein